MKKIKKFFMDLRKEQEWLSNQVGWRLVDIKDTTYTFEESSTTYNYEYIYFNKSKEELGAIQKQITDKDIEFVCSTPAWALFRKDATKGKLNVYTDPYLKYKMLMDQYSKYLSLGGCYLCLGASQITFMITLNSYWGIISGLFYLVSVLFFRMSTAFHNYALEYETEEYKERLKKEK